MKDILELAKSALEKSEMDNFGIFGTAIGTIWLDAQPGERAKYFLDEDPGLIGKLFFGRPVIAPGEKELESHIFIPIAPDQANDIASRLNNPRHNYYVPDPMPALV